MFGWIKLIDFLLGLMGKLKLQKKIKVANELKLESFKLHKRKLEREALTEIGEKISNIRDYLNKP